MRIKDESNKRIEKFVQETLLPFMDSEDRGFIFAPAPSLKKFTNHNTFTAVAVYSNIEFWATMLSIVDNVNKNIPEENRQAFKEGYKMFIKASAKLCFPTIKIDIENLGQFKKDE